MPLPDRGSRVRIVRVEDPDLAQFIGLEGSIIEFLGDKILIRLDGLSLPMEFTNRDVVLI